MHIERGVCAKLLLTFLLVASYPGQLLAQVGPNATTTPPQGTIAGERDGQHDFDFELGTWKLHLRRRLHALAGSDQWVGFDVDSFTEPVWGGRAQIEQFEACGPTRIEGLTLRLYDPQSHQWRLYWANSKDGVVGQPMIGEFTNRKGEFYDQELFKGEAIYVRYLWSDISPNAAHFEQSFSDDGGKTWETNWITEDTRVKDETAQTFAARVSRRSNGDTAKAEAQKAVGAGNGQHDFDFEFGTWKAHLRRLLHPLTGSHSWVDYEGTSTVRKIWDGRANLGELEVGDSNTRIEGLSLRLYNPQMQQWSISWANSREGSLGLPMIGRFNHGHGEFFDQELLHGRPIYVRFIFSDITPTSFHFEQSFSPDGGKTWEPNWIATFTRQRG
jgi:hypothetical protein